MLCDICKKNEATIFLNEFRDGECRTLKLCMECAAKRAVAGAAAGDKISQDICRILGEVGEAAIRSIMGDLVSRLKSKKKEKKSGGNLTPCPFCGKIPDEEHPLPGCSECYHAFPEIFRKIVLNDQADVFHVGRRPVRRVETAVTKQLEIIKLRRKLAAAVADEDYQTAIELRDRISNLGENTEKTVDQESENA